MLFKKNNTKCNRLWEILFIFLGIVVYFLSNLIGTRVPNIEYDSKIMSLTNLTRGESIAHLVIDSIDQSKFISFKDSKNLSSYFNGFRNRFRPYCKIDSTYSLDFENILSDVSFCSLNYYSDTDYTEYLNLPLFLDDSPMRLGPKYGADLPCYLPSSLADLFLEKLGLKDYNELLKLEHTIAVKVDDEETTFSINNIYLNNKSEHWNRVESDTYHLYFGEANPNSLLIYSSSLINNSQKAKQCFDLNFGYGNYDRIIRKCNTTLGEKLDYTVSSKGNSKINFTIYTHYFNSKFFNANQTPFFIAFIFIVIIQTLLLIFIKELRQKLLKIALVLFSSYLVIGTIIEIIKSAHFYNSVIYYFFNYIGGIFSLIYLMLIVIVYLILAIKEDKENGK